MFAYHTLETGQASGTAVSTGNSGVGGTAFSSVTQGTDAAVQYSNVRPRGALALRLATGATSAQAQASWNSAALGGSAATVRFRFVVRRVAGASGTVIMRLRAAGTQVARITFDAAGKIQLRNTGNTVVATSAGTMGANDWWLIRGEITAGNPTGAGTLHIHYTRSNRTPDETISASGANFATGTIDEANFGAVANVANSEIVLDDMVVTDGAIPGPAEQTVTAHSTISAADLTGRGIVFDRSAVSGVAVADEAGRAVSQDRVAASAVAVADLAGRTVAASRTAASGLAVADVVDRAVVLDRAAVSAIAVDDQADRSVVLTRTAAGAVAVVDQARRELVASRVAASGLGVADVAARTLALARVAASTVGIGDTVTAVVVPAGGTPAPTLARGSARLATRPAPALRRTTGPGRPSTSSTTGGVSLQ